MEQNWYKNKYFWILGAILLAAIGIRLYYFFITSSQVIFWDEAQYLATAKTYAGHAFEDLAGQRLPGFPLFVSLFFRFGISEQAVKFFVCFIPSIIMLVLAYILIARMYKDKRVALISTAILAVLWENLFWSNRFMTDNFGLLFELLALLLIYLFIEKKKWWLIPLAATSIILDVAFRPGTLMILPAIGVFIIISTWKENKTISFLTFISGILAMAIFYFVPSLQYIITSNFNTNNVGPAWNAISVFGGLLLSPFLYIPFFIGLFVGLFELFHKAGKEDSSSEDRKSNFLNFLLIASVLGVFIFIIRAPQFEFRWFFGLLPAVLCFTAKGIIDIADGIASVFGNSAKFISFAFIFAILGMGLFAQISYADPIIKAKAGSYQGIKDAGLWIKSNSLPNDIIFSISKPQTAYYSERKVMSYSLLNTTEQMNDYIEEYRPRYIEVSVYEPHPNWTQEWIATDIEANVLTPAFGAKFDNSNNLGALLYTIDYENLEKIVSKCESNGNGDGNGIESCAVEKPVEKP